MATVNDGLPVSLIAGDSRTFKWSESNHKATDGWTAKYYLHGDTSVIRTGTANGDEFQFTLTSGCTENWKQQTATYAVIVTKGTDRLTMAQGSITVWDNPAKSDMGQRVRDLENDLALIRSYRSNLITGGKLRSSFAGRSIEKIGVEELGMLEVQIAKELTILKYGPSAIRKTVRYAFTEPN